MATVKVLLIDPPNHCLENTGGSVQVHPLGIGYVAAVLATRHDVRQLIPDVRDMLGLDPWAEVIAAVEAEAPNVIGISAVTATFPSARLLAQRCRARLGPEVPIVMGGAHPTFRPDDAFAIAAVDYVVRGEGEYTMCELIDALETSSAVDGIAGLMWRDADGAVQRGPARAPNTRLDDVPFPHRDDIVWGDHLQAAFHQSIITLRGCPYRCIYCAIPASADRKTRYRSAENVADEIALMRRRWDIPYLFFHDSVFTLNRKRTTALLEMMVERDLTVPFACQTRTDRVDPALLEQLKAAGCHQIFFGIESGDSESLTKIRKSVPLDEIREAVRQVTALGIRCTGFFMVGFPWETEAHIRRSADFATSIGLDAVSLFSATPLPGTELWDLSRDVTIPESIDFRRPQINLTSMTPDQYAALYDDVDTRIRNYNRGRMQAGAHQHWPKG